MFALFCIKCAVFITITIPFESSFISVVIHAVLLVYLLLSQLMSNYYSRSKYNRFVASYVQLKLHELAL